MDDAPAAARDALSQVGQLDAVRSACTHLLLDVDRTASALGISRSTLYRFDSRELIPRPRQLGKLRRWSRDELRDWVDAGCPPRGVWEARRG